MVCKFVVVRICIPSPYNRHATSQTDVMRMMISPSINFTKFSKSWSNSNLLLTHFILFEVSRGSYIARISVCCITSSGRLCRPKMLLNYRQKEI